MLNIQVLSIELNQSISKNGKPYEQLVVAYKDLSNGGKVASKTIMPFGFQKDSFTTLKAAKPVDVYEVEVQKNEAGYNDWIRAKKGSAQTVPETKSVSTVASNGSSNAKSTSWETSEERAKKQIYIVRQSSISAAVNALSVGVKTPPKPEDVIEYAKQLESFVFSTGSAETVVRQDVGTIEDLEEDPIPF